MCIWKLSTGLMYQFHYYHIKTKYDNKSKLFFTATDRSIYQIKTEDIYENFRSNKEMFDFSNNLTESKRYDVSKKLGLNKYVIPTISQNKCKDDLLKNKFMRNSMNRIQSEDYTIETFEIHKTPLPCFDDKIYTKNNGYDGLTLVY